MTDLPEVSLTGLDDPNTLATLRNATHEIGFFFLADHGVDPGLERDVLEAARALFALPEADKRAVEMLRSPHFRGYTLVGGEFTQGRRDWREQIDLGPERRAIDPPRDPWDVLEGPNQWPSALPQLRDVVLRWQAALDAVARQLLHGWARALGQDEQVFDAAFGDRPSTLLKLIRYPGRAAGEDDQGVGAHKDPGVLTLLWLEPGSGGLQVQGPDGWIDVPPREGRFVVNIGELLEVATDGYLRATTHRVVSPPAGTDRVSIPFFFNPALGARFPHLVLPPDLAAAARGVTDDPDNPLSDTFGANLLKARLRAHPDVAARHHPELVARR